MPLWHTTIQVTTNKNSYWDPLVGIVPMVTFFDNLLLAQNMKFLVAKN